MIALAAAVGLLAGCVEARFSRSIVNPLNLNLPFLPYEHPVQIGLVHDGGGIFDPEGWNLDSVTQLRSPATPLQKALQDELHRPVSIQELKPFQAAAHLKSGRLDFALLSAADFLRLHDEYGELGQVIAVSEVLVRRGLIVANVNSNITALPQIRGQRFSFGPRGDAVLDLGAKATLAEAGVTLDDLQKELLPIPNSLQHHSSAQASAFEIVYGLGTSVGVIEKADFDAYPQQGGNVLLRTFAKDNFRVLATTAEYRVDTISAGPFLASAHADAKLVDAVREQLAALAEQRSPALTAIGLATFHPPPDDVMNALRALAEVCPDGPTPDPLSDTQ